MYLLLRKRKEDAVSASQATYADSSDDDAALASLAEALKSGPVAVGMLDMGYLTYMPGHQQLYGVDHALVVLALQPETVIVHDPAG